jgi:hypothetical protein
MLLVLILTRGMHHKEILNSISINYTHQHNEEKKSNIVSDYEHKSMIRVKKISNKTNRRLNQI